LPIFQVVDFSQKTGFYPLLAGKFFSLSANSRSEITAPGIRQHSQPVRKQDNLQ
jgi:hypothetical protein